MRSQRTMVVAAIPKAGPFTAAINNLGNLMNDSYSPPFSIHSPHTQSLCDRQDTGQETRETREKEEGGKRLKMTERGD